MTQIAWTDDLRLGIAKIDGQHERLIGIINQLDKAAGEGRATEVISAIIDELIIYTATHFSMEEEYFDRFQYPDAAEHKQEHAALIGKVNEFANAFTNGTASGRTALASELVDFLNIWWMYHMRHTDTKFVKLFKERGVT